MRFFASIVASAFLPRYTCQVDGHYRRDRLRDFRADNRDQVAMLIAAINNAVVINIVVSVSSMSMITILTPSGTRRLVSLRLFCESSSGAIFHGIQ